MNVSQHISKNQKPQIVYILGGPGSGKGTQCDKLVIDYKFTHLSVGDLMRAEIKSKSKEGEKIEKLVANGEIVPTDITVGLLLKAIKTNTGKRFLIDGFPRGVEQALYLERFFREIDFIINYDCPEETLVTRLVERGKTSGRADDNEETIRKRVQVFNQSTRPALDFYRRLGKVRTINSDRSVSDVYKSTLKELLPNVITFYGAPVLGKTTLAKNLARTLNYELLNLQDFYRAYNLTKAPCETKMDQLIAYLRDHHKRNFVIDSFPETLRQAKIFVEHFTHPLYTFYLDATKDEVENNVYTHIADKKVRQLRLAEYDAFIKERKAIVAYLKDKPFFTKVAYTGKSLEDLHAELVEKLAPQIIALHEPFGSKNFVETYCKQLEEHRGFTLIDLRELLALEIQRGTEIGNQILIKANIKNPETGSELPPLNQIPELVVEYLRGVIFADPNRKRFLIRGFFETKEEFDLFERNVCKVSNIMTNPHGELRIPGNNTPLAKYHAQGRVIRVEDEFLDIVDDFVTSNGKYGFIIGPQWSGKTTLAKHLRGTFANVSIDWEKLTEEVKKKLTPPDGDAPEEAPIDEINKEVAERIRKLKKSDVCLLDGLPMANGQLYTLEQLSKFLKVVGPPKFVFYLDASPETMENRFKLKNEVPEVPEEEKEGLLAKIEEGKKTVAVFLNLMDQEQLSIQLYQIDVNGSEAKAKNDLDSIAYKKVILLRRNQSIDNGVDLVDWVYTYGAETDLTIVDVPRLIQTHLEAKDEIGKKIEAQLQMLEEYNSAINPSNFFPGLILEIVQNFLKNSPKTTKYICIVDFPYADNKANQTWGPSSNCFPRALDELYQIETKLGPVRVVVSFTDEHEDYNIDDPVVEMIQVEEKKPEKPKTDDIDDGGDAGDGGNAPDANADDDPDAKPKFDPTKFTWTTSNGNPKTITKILHKKFSPVDLDIKLKNSLKPLSDALTDLIARIEEGDQQNYYLECNFE
mmetsp:Transcript_28305/g.32744  ORF Transcript_28305/g.32744 Transcript_28305/m.32744 type:complete len:975 (+) Transcript_28305:18-2942(+)